MLLADGSSTFFIKCKPVLSNGPNDLPKNPPNCPILYNWFFYNFRLADELFTKALRSLETSVLVNNDICTKVLSSLESQPTTWKF